MTPALDRAMTASDVERLVVAVEDGTLPRAEWTHAAHLAFAAAYTRRHGAERALDAIRAAILGYNAASGVPQTPDGGYHETLTRFYAWAVARELRTLPPDADLGAAATHVAAALADRTLPLRHYTKARLMSWEARTGAVLPDLEPIAADAR